MFEKVNPSHPDKLCDRIAGAIVDLAYELEDDPRIAVEVLLGHGICHIIAETDISLPQYEVEAAVERIAGKVAVARGWVVAVECLYHEVATGERTLEGAVEVVEIEVVVAAAFTCEHESSGEELKLFVRVFGNVRLHLVPHDEFAFC